MPATLTLFALILPLCVDTFVVAAALGVAGLPARERLRVSLVMTAFEAVMPLVGLAAGQAAGSFLGSIATYGAVFLLAALGIVALLSKADEGEPRFDLLARARGPALIGFGISVSLDELAIGFSLGLLRLPIVPAVILIAVQALIASQLGLRLGARLSEAARERSEKAAGLILLVLAALLGALQLLGSGRLPGT